MNKIHHLLRILAVIGRYGSHLMIVMIFVNQNNFLAISDRLLGFYQAAYLIFGLILKPVMSPYLFVCHVVCICLPVCPPLPYICLSVCLCPPGCSCLSLNLSVCDCLSVSLLHICPPVRRPVPLLICLSNRLHLCLSVCLPVCLFVSLPTYQSVCLSL